MISSLKESITFVRNCLRLMAENRAGMLALIGLSILATLTEGMTISLLVPILNSQGGGSFADIPLLGKFASAFDFGSPLRNVQMAGLLLMVVVILRGVLQFNLQMLAITVPHALQRRLTAEAFDGVLAVEIGYINNTESGYLLNQFRYLPQRVSMALTGFVDMCWNLALVIVYCCFMLLISWQLTLLSVVTLGILTAVLKRLSAQRALSGGQELTQCTNSVNTFSMETLMGMKLIRLSAAEGTARNRFMSRFDTLISIERKLARITAFTGPALVTGASIFVCLLLIGGSYVVDAEPDAWLGQLLLMLFLLSRLLSPMTAINVARTRIMRDKDAMDEMDAFIAECRRRRQPSGEQPFVGLQKEITFENVSFAYDPSKGSVLNNVSFTLRKGQTIAVVGPSGAGKTTLISLLTRLWDPTEGRITVDGCDLRELNVGDWRRQVAIVSQDTVLFNDSILNNLTFGMEGIAREKVEEAVAMAAADEFIKNLPMGLDTWTGDRAVQLSGGQQQRLALARAILKNADVLVLDEATSQLDAITESTIQKAVATMQGKRTILVIAHRLSTIRNADVIIVMKAGQIAEVGRYDELAQSKGVFSEMLQHQNLDLVGDQF